MFNFIFYWSWDVRLIKEYNPKSGYSVFTNTKKTLTYARLQPLVFFSVTLDVITICTIRQIHQSWLRSQSFYCLILTLYSAVLPAVLLLALVRAVPVVIRAELLRLRGLATGSWWYQLIRNLQLFPFYKVSLKMIWIFDFNHIHTEWLSG